MTAALEKKMIHITNWSSRKLHGPGRKWSIMAKPRRWEHGDGSVPAFVPDVGDLLAVRAGEIDALEYSRRCMEGVLAWLLAAKRAGLQGNLRDPLAITRGTTDFVPLADGDTLLCACSRIDAARGRCHRVVAADLLRLHGWTVCLDGAILTPMCLTAETPTPADP